MKTNLQKVAYIFTYIIPVVLMGLLNSTKLLMIEDLLKIILSILICIGIYEIGYILNDTISIKKEKNPTLRLEENEIKYIQKNINKILILKFVVSTLLFIILKLAFNLVLVRYVLVVVLILAVYYIHNNFRNNKITYITFFCLSTLRFFTPNYLLAESNNEIINLLLSTVLLFSLIRNFEEIGHKKYYIKNINIHKIRHEFRVGYYLAVLLIVTLISKVYIRYSLQNIKLIIGYLLLYRFTICILLKYKKRRRKI
ncbi:MAG: hypothetical protein ACRC51_04620 [Cetobacterium sp.]